MARAAFACLLLFASIASAEEAAVCSGEADTCKVRAEGPEIAGLKEDTTLMQGRLKLSTGAVKSAEQEGRGGTDVDASKGQLLQAEGFRANQTQAIHWDSKVADSVRKKVEAAVGKIHESTLYQMSPLSVFTHKTDILKDAACKMEKAYVRSIGGSVGAVFGVGGSIDVGCGYIPQNQYPDYKMMKCATYFSVCASGGVDGGADVGISWAEMNSYGDIAGFAAEVGVDVCFGVCGGLSSVFCRQSDNSFQHCGGSVMVGLGMSFSVSGSICYTMQLPDFIRKETTHWMKKSDCERTASMADHFQETFKTQNEQGDEDGQDKSMSDYFAKQSGPSKKGNSAADFYR